MKKQLIYIANWKMNLTFDEELNFAGSHYNELIKLSEEKDSDIILCPSFVSLHSIIKIFKHTKIKIGAQNCSQHHQGSFTGQISAESLNLLGCNSCIIGHSESRIENKETNENISKKFEQLINYKISPIICIGETIEEYEKGKTMEILEKELEKIINIIKSNLNIPKYLPIYIAYEPIWAIGTKKIPSHEHLETIFTWLFTKIQKISTLIKWNLIYGGSVNSKNIKKIKQISKLSGFLIGGASLNFKEFENIVK